MNLFTEAFYTLLYKPLFNILILLYQFLPWNDFGIAVIMLTVLLRIFLLPFTAQSIRSQKAISEIQPKIQEIQEKFKEDQEKQAQEMMNLYKEKNINPFTIFLPMLVQLPLFIALFQVFSRGLRSEEMVSLYSFVPHPGQINYTFLGLISLSQASLLIALIAAVVQFIQLKTQTKPEKAKRNNTKSFSVFGQKQMPYFFLAFTFLFLSKLPAALGLYWITTSLFSIGQQYVIENYDKKR